MFNTCNYVGLSIKLLLSVLVLYVENPVQQIIHKKLPIYIALVRACLLAM